MTYVLRPGAAADAAAISALFQRSFVATFGHNYPPAELAVFLPRSSPELYLGLLNDPAHALLVGEQDGVLTGFCLLGPQADLPVVSDARWWVLRQLYLDIPAQGTGMGQELLDWAIAHSRAEGFQELYLTVWIENARARRFYDRNGFVETGRYEYKVGSVVDDDRIMRFSL